MPINKEYSKALDLLRFPLALVVMIVHMFGAIGGGELQGEVSGQLDLVVKWMDGFLRGQSVPVYFFISGYVFFAGVDWSLEVYRRKLKNRLHTLLIPYVLWNTIAIGLFLLRFLPWVSAYVTPEEQSFHPTLQAFLSCYWQYNNGLTPEVGEIAHPYYPLNIPLWFIRDLMIVVLCSPLVYTILRRFGGFPLLLGFAWYLGLQFVEDGGHVYLLTVAFLFFSWGAHMGINRRNLLEEFARYKGIAGIVYVLSSVAYVAWIDSYPTLAALVKCLGVTAGLLTAFNLASWLIGRWHWTANRFLSSSSFFIYVSHILVCMKIVHLLEKLLSPSTAIQVLLVYCVALAVSLLLLLGLYWGMKRYTPRLLLLLTGRR